MSSTSPTNSTARRRYAFVCAAVLTLIVGFYVLERWRGNATWKTYEAEARARGVKLTLAEYVPPPVPDERNFAAVPIFQDAFQKPEPPNPLAFPTGTGGKQPPVDSVVRGQLIDLAAWQKFFVEAKLLPAAGESAAGDVLKALEHYAPQFEQLRIAGARPDCRFPVRYEDGAGATLPHLGIIQSAARLYALRLAAHLALGDSAAAYENFRSGLRLRAVLEAEPTLLAGLVRVSVLAVVENAVWAGLAQRLWAAPELEKIAADLAGVRLMDDYALGLGSERGFSNMIHEQLLQKGAGELVSMLMMANGPDSFSDAGPARALLWLYPTGWLRLSQTRANRYFDEMLARVAQEPPRLFPERPVPSWPRERKKVGAFERMKYLLFLGLTPALNEVERSYAYGQTLLDQTRLGCALERYRLARGSFPSSLEALVPAFIPALPRDVMTGGPLHYRTTENGGYLLYSVAWNLTDDGGKVDLKANAKQQADWVWSLPGK